MPSEPTTTGETQGFGLTYDPWERLVLIDAQGRRHVGVEPIRSFPLSDPSQWISLCDAEGREIVCLEDLTVLPPRVREVLEEELKRREFMPRIYRLVGVSGTAPSEWQVETDRGATTFLLKSEEDIRRIGAERILIVDAFGCRYLVADIRALDSASRRMLERYL
jgi:uncharacterized protein DUF1854